VDWRGAQVVALLAAAWLALVAAVYLPDIGQGRIFKVAY
jgi:hypothetical protein